MRPPKRWKRKKQRRRRRSRRGGRKQRQNRQNGQSAMNGTIDSAPTIIGYGSDSDQAKFSIVNLSNHVITDDERRVLELG